MVAYHSVLVFNVLGVSGFDEFRIPAELPATDGDGQDVPQPIRDLFDCHRELNARNVVEAYHDATAAYEQVLTIFNLGYLSLELRSLAEQLFWSICSKIVSYTRQMKRVPKELRKLPDTLLDTYFVNVSVFQSLPDSWAINQKFPIMPIHRLGEQPSRLGMLADITCDSDGRIDHFIDAGKSKNALELHPFTGGDYLLAAFLVGAYQEILGDLHNLFGDTHAVHVSLDEDGDVVLEHLIDGDTVREVLSYVEFNADELLARMRREVERAIKAGKLTIAESAQLMRFYEKGLNGYTYLEEPHPD
jgi:arginine decarboxylase